MLFYQGDAAANAVAYIYYESFYAKCGKEYTCAHFQYGQLVLALAHIQIQIFYVRIA